VERRIVPITYIPAYAVERDAAKLRAFIRTRNFCLFAAAHEGDVLLAQAPVVLGEGVLQFHLAKGNPFLKAAHRAARAKAVFWGPDAYVSPDWYVSENQVPTWNFVSVLAEGPMRVLSREEMVAQVNALTAEQEARLLPKKPWTRDKMAPGSDTRMFAAIEGVEMRIVTLEGKFKLSQNKFASDVEGVIRGLETRGDPLSLAVAGAMRPSNPKK
jgi:transcriptional regulator